MPKEKWTDDDLLAMIRGSYKQNEMGLKLIHANNAWRESVFKVSRMLGLEHDEFEDVFIETLITFDQNIRENKFNGASALKTYFLGISRNKALKVLEQKTRRNKLFEPRENLPENSHDDNPQKALEHSESLEKINKAINMLTDECRKIILLLQADYDNDEIARELGFRDGADARKFVYRCRMKLRELLNLP